MNSGNPISGFGDRGDVITDSLGASFGIGVSHALANFLDPAVSAAKGADVTESMEFSPSCFLNRILEFEYRRQHPALQFSLAGKR